MQFNAQVRRSLCVLVGAAIVLGTQPETVFAQVQMLPEIVVTSSRIPVPSTAVGSTITVVTGDEIEAKQARSIGEVLREVPSVAVNRTGGFGATTQVRIRGAEANQTLTIIDGIEVGDPANGSEFDFGAVIQPVLIGVG